MSDIEEANEKESISEGDATRGDAYIGFAIGGIILVSALIFSFVSGFGPYEGTSMEARTPTLWDWMELLIVPAVLLLIASWFNKSQKDTELNIAEESRTKDREIAEKARTTDREIAESRQRQATLEAYYDRMTELLLEHNLRNAAEGAEVRSIASARTIAVVRNLDGKRNCQLIAFLSASKLIEKDYSIIDLSRADLSETDLSRAGLTGAKLTGSDLTGVNLFGVDLTRADLTGANLTRAILSKAILREANLSEAKLTEANLSEANLFGVDLTEADLTGVDLTGAILSEANLRRANLNGAILFEADLHGANLSEANLSRAILHKANLSRTILHKANLTGADLTGTNLTEADLSEVDLALTKLISANLSEANLSGAGLILADLSLTTNWRVEQLEQLREWASTYMPDRVQLIGPNNEGPTFEEWKALYLARQKAEMVGGKPDGEPDDVADV